MWFEPKRDLDVRGRANKIAAVRAASGADGEVPFI
jgi:hypothetical protein